MPSEQVSSSSSWGWGGLKDRNLAIADIQNSAEGNTVIWTKAVGSAGIWTRDFLHPKQESYP